MPKPRGGGKGRSKGGGPPPREVQLSKSLSWILRHGAKSEGIPLDEGGWANVRDILSWRKLSSQNVTFTELQQIVSTNDKQRFTLIPNPAPELPRPTSPHSAPYTSYPTPLSPNGTPFSPLNNPTSPSDPSRFLIRAAQGHSIKEILSQELLNAILPTDVDCPVLVVHGTYNNEWAAIKRSGGLKPMTRNHIHFARDVPPPLPPLGSSTNGGSGSGGGGTAPVPQGEGQVISGMRRDSSICIWVDVRGSMAQGVRWWRGDNGVILTEGLDVDGSKLLGLEFVVWTERRGVGEVLYGDKEKGVAMKEMVERERRERVEGVEDGVRNLVVGVNEERNGGVRGFGGVKQSQDVDDRDDRDDHVPVDRNKNYAELRAAQVRENWDDSREGTPDRP